MISFIIIGKNEGWKLSKCFDSVFATISSDSLTNSEVIYVDSKSSDSTLEVVKRYVAIRSFVIDGHCNPAIARDVGAQEAKGDILFFIDGDMEIQPGFCSLVIKDDHLIYPFLSGIWMNKYYDSNWNYVSSNYSSNNSVDVYEDTVGGLFIIDRSFWQMQSGMDSRFDRNEDTDFGYRMNTAGCPLLRKSFLLAVHHTIDYTLRPSSSKYYRSTGFLLRKHFLSSLFFKQLLYSYYTIIILIVSIILSCIFSPFFLILYITFVLYKSIRMIGRVKTLHILPTFWFYLSRDFIIVFSFFFYYPSSKDLIYHTI